MSLQHPLLTPHRPDNLKYKIMFTYDDLTYIRRGNGVYFRVKELPDSDREQLKKGLEVNTGKTILKHSKGVYYVLLAPGFKWNDSSTHYPVPVPK